MIVVTTASQPEAAEVHRLSPYEHALTGDLQSGEFSAGRLITVDVVHPRPATATEVVPLPAAWIEAGEIA